MSLILLTASTDVLLLRTERGASTTAEHEILKNIQSPHQVEQILGFRFQGQIPFHIIFHQF